MGKIAARYIGDHEKILHSYGGPYFNGDGSRRESLILHPGDVIMVDEQEVNGMTVLLDPRHEKDPEHLGTGRIVKDEHAGLSNDELSVVGYQFHEGRRDFEPVPPVVPAKKSDRKDEAK